MPNIEIKAKYQDLEKARAFAKKHHTEYLGILHQIDTYFETKVGRLKLREINGEIAQLIPYSKDYQSGPMKSDYALLEVNDPKHIKELFSTLLGQEFVVDKKREVFLIDNVRVHLDQVKDLGNFLEFEAVYENESERPSQEKKVEELMQLFQVQEENLLNRSYVDYLGANLS